MEESPQTQNGVLWSVPIRFSSKYQLYDIIKDKIRFPALDGPSNFSKISPTKIFTISIPPSLVKTKIFPSITGSYFLSPMKKPIFWKIKKVLLEQCTTSCSIIATQLALATAKNTLPFLRTKVLYSFKKATDHAFFLRFETDCLIDAALSVS